MRMRHHHGPSVFSSLGQALHIHHAPKYGPCTLKCCDPRAIRFEQYLAERLMALEAEVFGKQYFSLQWMHQALELITSTISEAQGIIPSFVSPLSEWDEVWVSKYLEDTCRLLDVLNATRKIVAELEHRQMLLKLAASTLSCKHGTAEERLSKARKSIIEYEAAAWQMNDPAVSSKVQESLAVLHDMLVQPFDDKAIPHKRRSFLGALYGAKVLAVAIMGVVVTLLFGTAAKSGVADWEVPEQFSWSKPLHGLLQQLKKQQMSVQPTSSLVHELAELDTQLKNLQSLLAPTDAAAEAGLAAEQEEAIVQEAEKLQLALKCCEEGIDLVRQQMDKLFHVIVSNRNSLLGYLRQENEEEASVLQQEQQQQQ